MHDNSELATRRKVGNLDRSHSSLPSIDVPVHVLPLRLVLSRQSAHRSHVRIMLPGPSNQNPFNIRLAHSRPGGNLKFLHWRIIRDSGPSFSYIAPSRLRAKFKCHEPCLTLSLSANRVPVGLRSVRCETRTAGMSTPNSWTHSPTSPAGRPIEKLSPSHADCQCSKRACPTLSSGRRSLDAHGNPPHH